MIILHHTLSALMRRQCQAVAGTYSKLWVANGDKYQLLQVAFRARAFFFYYRGWNLNTFEPFVCWGIQPWCKYPLDICCIVLSATVPFLESQTHPKVFKSTESQAVRVLFPGCTFRCSTLRPCASLAMGQKLRWNWWNPLGMKSWLQRTPGSPRVHHGLNHVQHQCWKTTKTRLRF